MSANSTSLQPLYLRPFRVTCIKVFYLLGARCRVCLGSGQPVDEIWLADGDFSACSLLLVGCDVSRKYLIAFWDDKKYPTAWVLFRTTFVEVDGCGSFDVDGCGSYDVDGCGSYDVDGCGSYDVIFS